MSVNFDSDIKCCLSVIGRASACHKLVLAEITSGEKTETGRSRIVGVWESKESKNPDTYNEFVQYLLSDSEGTSIDLLLNRPFRLDISVSGDNDTDRKMKALRVRSLLVIPQQAAGRDLRLFLFNVPESLSSESRDIGVYRFLLRATVETDTETSSAETINESKKKNKGDYSIDEMLNVLPDNIFIINTGGVIEKVYDNDPAGLLVSKTEMTGKVMRLPPDIKQKSIELIWQAITENKVVTHHYSLMLNGEERFFESRMSPLSGRRVLAIVREETERKRLEQEAETYKRYLEKSAAIAKIGLWERSLVTGRSKWSPGTFNLLEYNSLTEDASYEILLERIHPEDRAEFNIKIQNVISQKSPFLLFARLLLPSGVVRHVEIRGEVVVEGGAPVGLMGIIHDITDLKIAERAIRENELQYRTYIDESPIAVLITGHENEFIRTNPAATKITGYSRDEFLGMKFGDLAHPSSFVQLAEHLHEVKNTVNKESEIKIIRADGRVADIQVNSRMLPNNETVTFCEDITEKKKLIDQLNENSRRFSNYFGAISDLVYFYDIRTRKITYASNSQEKIIGSPENPAVSEYEYWIECVHHEDRESVRHSVSRTLLNGNDSSQYRILDKSGKTRWFWDRNWVVYDEHRNPVRIEGLRTEITESKEHERLIQNSLEKQKELNEMKSRFISTTSHEFRTPLTSIYSSTELLEYYGDKWDSKKRHLHYQKIKDTVDHLKKLLEAVLNINRSEFVKIEFNPKEVNLKDYCEEILEEFPAVKYPHLRLDFRFMAPNAVYKIDELLMGQVLRNLLSNAHKYSPKEGSITFIVEKRDDKLIFSIQDEGIGIPTGDSPHIFEPFFRAKNTMNIEGTGLGMSIVRNAVEAHGGKVNFISTEGSGTLVIAVIPAEMIIKSKKNKSN